MSKLQMTAVAVLLSLVLAALAQSAPLTENSPSSRMKRPSADVRVAEYLAMIALGGKLRRGCPTVGCGVVDIYRSGKKKRGSPYTPPSDEERYNLLKALVERAAMENAAE